MNSLNLLIGSGVLLLSAVAADQEYKGKTFDQWRERTTAGFSLAEREAAIVAIENIARARAMRKRTPEEVEWTSQNIVPALVGLLHDEEAKIRERGALALCWVDRKSSPAAIPALVAVLVDPNERVRGNAASALTWHGPAAAAAIPALTRVLEQDESDRVREKAAIALRTAGPEGVAVLVGLLDDQRTEVRRLAVQAFVNTYPTSQISHTPPEALPKLLALLADESPAVRKAAAVAIVSLTPPPPEAVEQILKQDDLAARQAAVAALLERNQAELFQDQLLKYVDSDAEFRRRYSGLLSRLGPQSIPVLLKLLDDDSPSVRGYAASALGNFGSKAEAAVPALKKLLSDLTAIPRGDLDDRVCHHAGLALSLILNDKSYRDGLPPRRPDGK
jgi:HEAT repeat protein